MLFTSTGKAGSRLGRSPPCAATCDGSQVAPAFYRIRQIRRRHRLRDGLGYAPNQVVNREIDLRARHRMVYWGQGTQENNDGRQVLVGKLAEELVRHHREERTPVMSDAFANTARQRIVAPVADAGFGVR